MLLAELELSAQDVRTARLVAGRVAMAAGLDEETADDVRLAVGEVCARRSSTQRLLVRFHEHQGEMSVSIEGAWSPTAESSDDERDLGWVIIEAVVPRVTVEPDGITFTWPVPPR